MLINVTFHDNVPFSPSSNKVHRGEEDDILIYTTMSSLPTPPVLQVYSRRPRLPELAPIVPTGPILFEPVPALCPEPVPAPCPEQISSSLDQVPNDDLPIALRKGKRKCTYLVSSFLSYDNLSPSSYSFIASIDSVALPKMVK